MTHSRARLLMAFILVSLAGSAAAESRARRPDGPCANANVEVDEQHQKVVVSFSNHCEARVSCAVSWSLRCGKGEAKSNSESVSIDGHSENKLEASAATCGDGDWRITPPRWRCEEPAAPIEELVAPRPRRRR